MKFKAIVLAGIVCSLTATLHAQKSVRALFLGNSYTDVNNLPEIVKQLALSAGDTLIYSKNAPGGYTLQGHSTNPTSLNLIQAGNWDYVVLQEQSQLPAFPDAQVISQVYPYAHALDSMIKVYNPCATTLFYMTWGRKFGDASNCANFPPICTYEGMDSLLYLRYTIMAQDNGAGIAPVGRLWHSIRDNHPAIDLYSSDNSHPNNNGSFAAACAFYAVMFDEDPQQAPYNYTVNAAVADTIKMMANEVVYDSLDFWYRFVPDIVDASFSYIVNGNTVTFTNTSQNAVIYNWDFGDGQISTSVSPSHTFAAPGTYTVELTASDSCSRSDDYSVTITITATGLHQLQNESNFSVYPNPVQDVLYITTSDEFDELQINDLCGRKLITVPFYDKNEKVISVNIQSLPAGIYMLTGYRSGGMKSTAMFSKISK